MYDAYWGLKRPLFTPAAVRQALASSPVHTEALARLDFLRESGGSFGLLMGPSGSGKSAVLAEFAERSRRSGALVALANAAATDEFSLILPIAVGLQIAIEGDAPQIWRRIADRFEEIQLEGVAAIVLLDDLDRASANIIRLVEQLLTFGGQSLTIVASAGITTAARIGSRLLDQVALRIDLVPWSHEETQQYLATSLQQAGRQQPAFDESAARRLFELSGGSPRKVNQLAQLALVAGAGQELIQIAEETVEAVHEELSVAR